MDKKRTKGLRKIMGLAASQARFLCITARKADCEYKSTDLAQQKLNITAQLSAISSDYANSMNATKLMWANDTVQADYGLSYGLLMTPSAVNDFNPYMITSPSGAIILNGAYAAAAEAAGISKGGGVGSAAQRNKFIEALASNGLTTEKTAASVMAMDWNPLAGNGGEIKNKSVVDAMTLSDLIVSNLGQQPIDWSVFTIKEGQISEVEYNENVENFDTMAARAKKQIVDDNTITTFEQSKLKFEQNTPADKKDGEKYNNIIKRYDDAIEAAKEIKNGSSSNYGDLASKINLLRDSFATWYKDNTAGIDDTFNLTPGAKVDASKVSVVINGVVVTDKDRLNSLTIGDLFSQNVVIVDNRKGGEQEDITDFTKKISKIIDYIYQQFSRFDIDDASADALKYALNMTKRQFRKHANYGTSKGNTLLNDNSAYSNAKGSNKIGMDNEGRYLAVSLSNIMDSFLTYFDNGLNLDESPYVVGDSRETSDYVTDNPNYYYLFRDTSEPEMSMATKVADFYDELYNNILAHGWRADSSIDDQEYLESMIKDGRYSMSSLHNDGHYYQTRYNETGYVVEVSDTDAIARAEAEFSAKKAELTYKEDSIDLKTKKLDVEISALNQEYQSVQTMISNGIQKIFSMFQS